MPKVYLCKAEELTEGQAKCLKGEGYQVSLVKVGEEIYCIDDICSHGAFSLSEGEVDVEECTIECPKHGSLFDLKTGEPLTLPATVAVSRHELFLEGSEIFVEIKEEQE